MTPFGITKYQLIFQYMQCEYDWDWVSLTFDSIQLIIVHAKHFAYEREWYCVINLGWKGVWPNRRCLEFSMVLVFHMYLWNFPWFECYFGSSYVFTIFVTKHSLNSLFSMVTDSHRAHSSLTWIEYFSHLLDVQQYRHEYFGTQITFTCYRRSR